MGGISSLAIRIPHEVLGCADEVCPQITGKNTLVISPPGGGKTTLLRDLIRQVSDGGYRVALADERGEVAAVWNGLPQFDVGVRTDVMTGGTKARTVLMMLKAMNPQVIAMDEITAPEDLEACAAVSNCGVELLATIHGADVADLQQKPLYRALAERGIFQQAVVIRREAQRRKYEVIPLC
jgi:stage III sporulation protein AA